MLSLRDLIAAKIGVGLLIRLDERGFDYFDASPAGFWRSFWAAVLLFPFWAFLMFSQPIGLSDHPLRFVTAQILGYGIGWLAYAYLALGVVGFLGHAGRYLRYIVAYNWFQLVQGLLWVPAVLLGRSGLLPPGAAAWLWLVCYGVLMFYGWFIARRGLGFSAGNAALLVMIDFFLGVLVNNVANSIALSGG